MTNLGATQLYDSGTYYRNRYISEDASHPILNVSSEEVVTSQIWASAPDQGILYQTATNFLQGLYPPLNTLNTDLAIETLTDGSETISPLDGYQFILIHGEDTLTPDTIWIKGDDQCPAYDEAYDSYAESAYYQDRLASTASFYERFIPLLGDIMGPVNVSYANAYDVFDLLNVASIHNASVAESISQDDLDQLRYLANEWEWHHNFNATMPDRSIGGMTLAGGILRQLADVVESKAKVKFSLMAGSYDTQMAFYGLTNLTNASADFFGLPNYAGSIAFELFTDEDTSSFPEDPDADLRVRFLFKNGTEDAEATVFPLFGGTVLSMPYGEFVDELGRRAILDVEDWCARCAATADFCLAYPAAGSEDSGPDDAEAEGSRDSGLSNAAAGGIGAAVTLAVVGAVGALAWLLARRKSKRTAGNTVPVLEQEKKSLSTSGSGVSV